MKNLEYYTELPPLPFKDYGRNILQIIEEIKKIPSREERNYHSNQLIKSMSAVNPQQKDMTDYKKKLWHHLFILANYELEVDCPYDLSELEKNIEELPHERLTYHYNPPRFRQYGKNIEILIEKIIEMHEGEQKNYQIQNLANLMKLCAQKMNEEKVEDDTIFQHLAVLSGGKLILNKEKISLQTINISKNKSKNKNNKKKHNPNYNKNKKFYNKK